MTDTTPTPEALGIARDIVPHGMLAGFDNFAPGTIRGIEVKLQQDIARALDAFAREAVEREREQLVYAVRQLPDGVYWVDWSPAAIAEELFGALEDDAEDNPNAG